jgi:hypothetical protein
LTLKSKKPIAQKFLSWIVEEVIPSIKNTGSYSIDKELQTSLKEINLSLKEQLLEKDTQLKEKDFQLKDAHSTIEQLQHRVYVLENNQKKIKYPIGGMVYIARYPYGPYKDLLKPGKTEDFNKRNNTYNTSVPDGMEVLYTLEVDDPDRVEKCLKNILEPLVYRGKKEYYRCDLKTMIKIINHCEDLVTGEWFNMKEEFSDQQSHVTSQTNIIELLENSFDIEDNDIFLICVDNYSDNQYGGSFGSNKWKPFKGLLPIFWNLNDSSFGSNKWKSFKGLSDILRDLNKFHDPFN